MNDYFKLRDNQTLVQQLQSVGDVVGRHIGYVRKNFWQHNSAMPTSDFAEKVLKHRGSKIRNVKLVENMCLKEPTKGRNRKGRLRDEFLMPHASQVFWQYNYIEQKYPKRIVQAKHLLMTLAYGAEPTMAQRRAIYEEVRWILQSDFAIDIIHVRDETKCNHGMIFHDSITIGYFMCRLLGLSDYDAYSMACVTARRLVWDTHIMNAIQESGSKRANIVECMQQFAEEYHCVSNTLINSLLSVKMDGNNGMKIIEPHLVPPPTQFLVEYFKVSSNWSHEQTWMIRKSGTFVRQNVDRIIKSQLHHITYENLIAHIDDPYHKWTWSHQANGQTHTCRIIQASDRKDRAMVKVTVIPDFIDIGPHLKRLLAMERDGKRLH